MNGSPGQPVVTREGGLMDRLDRAVSALKGRLAVEPGLSTEARSRIAGACWEDLREPLESFRPSFSPRSWLPALVMAPVLVAALVALDVNTGGKLGGAEFVSATKSGSEVVFEVADGSGPHTVIKSTSPVRFNPAAATVVEDGRYADLAQSGPVIVYYRID